MYICMHVHIQLGEVNMSGLRPVKARDEPLVSFSRIRALTSHLLTDRISHGIQGSLTQLAGLVTKHLVRYCLSLPSTQRANS